MSTLVKRLIMGLLLGVLIVFAVVGIKSTLQRPASNPVPNATTAIATPPSSVPATTTPTPTPPETSATPTIPAPADTQATQTEKPSIMEPNAEQDVAQNPDTSLPATIQGTPQASLPNNSQQSNPTNVPQPPANTAATTPNTPQMVDIPTPAPVLGKLQLVLIDPTNLEAKPRGNFIITDSQDVQVAMQQNSDVGIFELPPGTYKATVSINGKRNTRTVQIAGNQTKLENFTLPPSMTTPPPTATNPAPVTNEPPIIQEGTLQVIVKAAGSGQAVRANIYVQKPNGVHIASKTYTTTADFLLEQGSYKITVKAKDRADLVQDIKIAQGKATRATFNMQAAATTEPVLKPANPPVTNTVEPVNPAMPPIVNLPAPELNKPILEPMVPPLTSSDDPRLRPVPNNRLPDTTRGNNNGNSNGAGPALAPNYPATTTFTPGSEVDTVQNPNEAPRFTTPMGTLELHAVSGIDNSPLAVDFTVTDLRGNVLERFRGVSIAEIQLPAQSVLVNIHYRGMRGRETINVTAGAPTVYTFTVTPSDQNADLTN